jgi:hypothetical protein
LAGSGVKLQTQTRWKSFDLTLALQTYLFYFLSFPVETMESKGLVQKVSPLTLGLVNIAILLLVRDVQLKQEGYLLKW